MSVGVQLQGPTLHWDWWRCLNPVIYCNLLQIRVQGAVWLCALGKGASHDTSVVVGPLPVSNFIPGITQKMGELMLSVLSGGNGMSNLSFRDLSSRAQSENTYILGVQKILGVQEKIAWALECFLKCTSIARRYQVRTGENNSILSTPKMKCCVPSMWYSLQLHGPWWTQPLPDWKQVQDDL